MEPVKTMGIVIRSTTVGDYNKMLTVLSAELGRISVWARGAKSQKHDAHSSMSPLCYSEFVLLDKGDTYTLSSASLQESFYGLRNSVEALAYAMYFASFADKIAPQGVEAKEILRLLLNSLYFLEKGLKDREDLRLAFELAALTIEGYSPTFDACCECGNANAEWFDAESGGVVCGSCRPQGSKRISPAARQLMNYYTCAPLKDALYFSGEAESVKEGIELCGEFVKRHLGHIPALDYLKTVI